MAAINLLPEEIKQEEENLLKNQGNSGFSGGGFHVPNSAPRPIEPKIEAVKLPVTNNIVPEQSTTANKPLAQASMDTFRTPEKLAPKPIPTPQNQLTSKDLVEQDQKNNNQANSSFIKSSGVLQKMFGAKNSKGKILNRQAGPGQIAGDTGENFDVNLIPEGSNLVPNEKIYRGFLLAAIYGISAIALFYGLLYGLAFYFGQEDLSLTAKLKTAQTKFEALKIEQDKTLTAYNQLQDVKQLLAEHIYWSNFFSFLEKNTIPEVYYKDFNSAADGSITIAAVGQNFLAVARQYLVFQQDANIKQVRISGLANGGEEGVGFSISLTINPEILNKPIE